MSMVNFEWLEQFRADERYQKIARLLRVYFNYEFYESAIRDLRDAIEKYPTVAADWEHLVATVHSRSLRPNQAVLTV